MSRKSLLSVKEYSGETAEKRHFSGNGTDSGKGKNCVYQGRF